jgi:Dyp-type peroxidase family
MGINVKDYDYNSLLSTIQGNILKGHGRNHTTHIFIQFKKETKTEAIKWIVKLASQVVTSAQKQFRERELYKSNRVSGSLFATFCLSAEGYKILDLKMPPRNGEVGLQADEAFARGMKQSNTRTTLSDPPVNKWQEEYQRDLHAMLLLADDDADAMAIKAKTLIEEISLFGEVALIEYGHVVRNREGNGIEHFGYVDGISQPLFLQDELDAFKKGKTEPLLWDPEADLNLVLVQDMPDNENAMGSYFVFRKLEQNVKGFMEAKKKLANEIDLMPSDEQRVGAMIMGRFADGTPVTMSGLEGIVSASTENNFNYKSDTFGAKCPWHAHIRKVNPRGTSNDETLKQERQHRIVRRGIPYGMRDVNPKTSPSIQQAPASGVGLLFMCYQASITNQFEFIQNRWSGRDDFPSNGAGMDAMIGIDGKFVGRYAQLHGNLSSVKVCNLGNFVTLKGGEYFFAPSIAFLKSLA